MAISNAVSRLRQQLVNTFQDPKYRPPPLPSVTFDLFRLTQREDADIEDIVRVLERDEMLAGMVLRLVASPVYAGRASVRSLRDAVIRLGVRTVRNVVFEAALRQSVFNLPEYNETIERIGRHSIATAYLARVVCRHARVNEDNAFLAGLLHDIGFAGLLFALTQKKNPAPPPLLEIWPELDALHETASKVVTKLWGIPQDLAVLVGNHHHTHTGSSSRIAAVLAVADSLSAAFAANIIGPPDAAGTPAPADAVGQVELSDSRTLLSIDDRTMERIKEDGQSVISQVLSI
jgi:HD-like signal output (HDOD) protein